jgi:hypothetical protein
VLKRAQSFELVFQHLFEKGARKPNRSLIAYLKFPENSTHDKLEQIKDRFYYEGISREPTQEEINNRTARVQGVGKTARVQGAGKTAWALQKMEFEVNASSSSSYDEEEEEDEDAEEANEEEDVAVDTASEEGEEEEEEEEDIADTSSEVEEESEPENQRRNYALPYLQCCGRHGE